jgi:hypothetical protein
MPSFIETVAFQEPAQTCQSFTSQTEVSLDQNIETSVNIEATESEIIVMNVYSKMKNLENRYMDLANLYKESLIDQTGSGESPLS